MFNHDVFITEYLKIINEENDKEKGPSATKRYVIKITRNKSLKNEVPELNEYVASIVSEQEIKDLFSDHGKTVRNDRMLLNELIGFVNIVESKIFLTDDKVLNQLKEKYKDDSEGKEDKEGKGEGKDGEEGTEGEAAAGEGKNAAVPEAKKTNAKKKAPNAQAAAKKDKKRKCSC